MTCTTRGIRSDCSLLIGALTNAKRWAQARCKPGTARRMLTQWLIVAVDHAASVTRLMPIDAAPGSEPSRHDIARMLDERIVELVKMSVAPDAEIAHLVADPLRDPRATAGTVAGMILTLPEFWRLADLPDAWLEAPSALDA